MIGAGARIGRNCVLYQQVTLGGAPRGDFAADRYPVIGDDVGVFAGAKLQGAVRVGDGACIGANAVVIGDVPAGRPDRGPRAGPPAAVTAIWSSPTTTPRPVTKAGRALTCRPSTIAHGRIRVSEPQIARIGGGRTDQRVDIIRDVATDDRAVELDRRHRRATGSLQRNAAQTVGQSE